jgi:hypothetical protein
VGARYQNNWPTDMWSQNNFTFNKVKIHSALGYNWSTMFLEDIDTGTWLSRLWESQMSNLNMVRKLCGTWTQERLRWKAPEKNCTSTLQNHPLLRVGAPHQEVPIFERVKTKNKSGHCPRHTHTHTHTHIYIYISWLWHMWKPQCRGYNWATPLLVELNTWTWLSRLRDSKI